MRRFAVLLAFGLVALPALAQASDPPLTLWYQPATGTMADESGQGNHGTLLRFDSTTDGLRDGVLRFDGVDDLVETTLPLVAPQELSIDLQFRTTTTGGKLVGLESGRNGTSGSFDRQLYLPDDGHLRFGVWDGRGENVSTLAPVTDGAWHEALAVLAQNGTQGATLTLYLDGTLQGTRSTASPSNYTGYWRLGGGSFARWTDGPTNAFFTGDIGEVRIYAAAVAPADITRGAGAASNGRIGGFVVEPQAPPVDVAGAVMTGIAVAATTSVLAARGFDALAFVKKVVLGSLADKWRDRTQRVLAWRLPSAPAGIVALGLMWVLVAAARPGGVSFRTALLLAGLAALVFKAVTILGGALMAIEARERPRYRLWTAGAVTLAVTSLVFHAPFGYTGFLDREARRKRGPTEEAFAALAGVGLAGALALVFVALGVLTSARFAAVGVTLALGAVASSALPFPTLAGNVVWRWNRFAGVTLGLLGLVPYVLYELGLLPVAFIIALGVVGLAAFTAAVVLEARRRAHAGSENG